MKVKCIKNNKNSGELTMKEWKDSLMLGLMIFLGLLLEIKIISLPSRMILCHLQREVKANNIKEIDLNTHHKDKNQPEDKEQMTLKHRKNF